MKLTLTARSLGTKGSLKQLRHLKGIPGVMYALNSVNSEAFTLRCEEFEAHLRVLPKGNLATKVFDVDFDGKKTKAIVKQIQYHPISYAILHVDLQEVEDQKMVRVNVPVICTNQDQCVGVKLGGQVKLIKRSVRVKCKVADLPDAFYVDLQTVGLGDVRRAGDLNVKDGVQVVTHRNNVLVSVAK